MKIVKLSVNKNRPWEAAYKAAKRCKVKDLIQTGVEYLSDGYYAIFETPEEIENRIKQEKRIGS